MNSAAPEKNIELLRVRMDELRITLRQLDPQVIAAHTASTFSNTTESRGVFRLNFWHRPTEILCPEFIVKDVISGKELHPAQQALVLYYYHTANGMPISNKWISFSDLQDGRFYARAYQGYTGHELAQRLKGDRELFITAATEIHGEPYTMGDASFIFKILPRVHLLVVFWQGDDEFPSNFQVLFNTSANHYLPTDACAIAGSMLTRQLIKAAKK